MKRVLRSLALVAIAVVSFSAAKAQNPHFVDLSWDASTISVSGKVAGLGNNELVTVTLSTLVSYNFDCQNPGGHKPRPFRDITLSKPAVSMPFYSDKNGVAKFSLTANTYSNDELAAMFCPNGNWKIYQPGTLIPGAVKTLVSATVSADADGTVITASY